MVAVPYIFLDFIEVFVRCPVEVAESRDEKGLYKKARSGEIKFFTSVSDPYEEPFNAELVCDTDKMSAAESARKVLGYLEERRIIKHRKRCICILGMHRSGTSALSGAISLTGVNLGQDIMGPQEDNVKGFYENNMIWRLNEKILGRLHSLWDDILGLPLNWQEREDIIALRPEAFEIINQEFGSADLIGMKDPRCCILIPFWKNVLAELAIEPVFVIAVRSPLEVASSLKKRNAFSLEKSVLLWLDHMLHAELYSRGFPRAFVSFDGLLDDPEGVIDYLAKALKIDFSKKGRDIKSELKDFLEPGLKHHHSTIDNDSDILRLAIDCFEIFSGLSLKEDISEDELSAIDSIRNEFLRTRKNFWKI